MDNPKTCVVIDTSRSLPKKPWHQKALRYFSGTVKAATLSGLVVAAVVALVTIVETGSFFAGVMALCLVAPLAIVSVLLLIVQVRIAKNVVWTLLGL